jgi:TRAP transporter TAXI family solute receptor
VLVIWLIAMGALALWLGSSRVQRLTIAGGPAGSETLALVTAIADVLNKEEQGFVIRVFESGGSSENLRLLSRGRIDMATIQADTPVPEGVSGVTVLYEDAYHLIARDDAEIASFSDLPGHRIAIPPKTSGQFNSFWFLAEHYGLKPESLNALPMAEEAANFAMEHGQVDAIFRVRAPGNEFIRELIGDKKLHLVPIVQSEALALRQPAIAPGVIPLGSYRGAPALPAFNLPTAVLDRLLVTRSDMDVTLIYNVTKAIFERRSDIHELSQLSGFIAPLPEDAEGVIPAHPGARSYFDREKPGFMQQNARLASAMLYLAAIVCSALLAVRSVWVKSRRLRMSQFNRRLMTIAGAVRHENDRNILFHSKHQLMDILGEVMTDLEKEKVSQEEFEHFTFTWQSVDALVRDRLTILTDPDFVQSGEGVTNVG